MAKRRTGPPFTTEVDLSASPGNSEVTIEVMEKKPGGEPREFIDESLSYFITAADAGMFPAKRTAPVQAAMELLSREDSAECVRRHCRAQGLDPGAYRILLGVLTQIHYKLARLTKVRMLSPPSPSDRVGLDFLLAAPFPARAAQVPFELCMDEELAENSEPVVRLKFAEKLGDERFESLKPRVAAWANLVTMGGYRDDLSQMISFPLVPGEFYMTSPTVAEFEVTGFDAPVMVFDSLINMAIKFHGTVCPVRSLEIE
jgi:hypothetical protein